VDRCGSLFILLTNHLHGQFFNHKHNTRDRLPHVRSLLKHRNNKGNATQINNILKLMSNFAILPCAYSAINITAREAEHSDSASLDIAAHRRTNIIATHPPAPSKFNRRQTRTPCEATSLQQIDRPELRCIKAMRRHICEQIYESELCPVIGEQEQEDLWASLDGMFMPL
jgi:hypothetical protein